MNIVIVSPGYPNEHNAAQNVFVQKLVEELADAGNTCTVIVPQNRLHKEYEMFREHRVDVTAGGNEVHVHFPIFRAFWRTEKFYFDAIAALGALSFRRSVKRVIRERGLQPDVLYAHFLDPAGTCVAALKKRYGAKAFAVFGESSFWALGKYAFQRKKKELSTLDGIISVSSENKRRLLEEGIIEEEKIRVIPNAINLDLFYPRDKAESREKFGFAKEDFIATFVGGFNNRKGVLRVAEALGDLEGVKIAFAGKGEQQPQASNQVHCAPVDPADMPAFLSAGDVFVLPTLNEGCCNAIVEAMGCDMAIVSSDRPFNYDVLNENNAILVDPEDVDAIRQAVIRLRDDPALRDKLAAQACADAKELGIKARAKRILDFIGA